MKIITFSLSVLLLLLPSRSKAQVGSPFDPVFIAAANPPATGGGTWYYAATNGSSGNPGTLASPWTLAHALANAGPSNTIVLLTGVYPSVVLDTPSLHSGLTVRAHTNWSSKITGSAASHGFTTEAGVSNVVVDGLWIDHSYLDGVKFNAEGSTVRNCWITFSGWGNPSTVTNEDESFSGQGVYSSQNNVIVERNLIENGGAWVGHDHGLYLSGTNVIVRNNVIRSNLAYGIQLYTGTSGKRAANCHVYNNLVYGNGTHFLGGKNCVTIWGAGSGFNVIDVTNYVYGNTFIGGTNYYVLTGGNGALMVTNNIIIGPNYDGYVIQAFEEPAVITCAYNLFPTALHTGDGVVDGGNNVISTTANFVDTSKGLYWLTSGSPARGVALPGVAAPMMFWGQGQSVQVDLGFAPYSTAFAADTRTLDPSAAGGANYWSLSP